MRSLLIPDGAAGLWLTVACTHTADREIVFSRIADSDWVPIWLEDFDPIADYLCHQLSGWLRWEAEHVWRETLNAWAIVDGDMQGRGVDLLGLPPARATNAVFAWWRKTLGSDENQWKKWTRDMRREPRRIIIAEADKEMSVAEMNALQALIGQASGRNRPVPTPDSTVTMP